MREIVALHGWPDRLLVEEDGAQAAWLLVQHADDLEFQRHCLSLMEKAAAGGLVDLAHVAYLTDRVRMKEGRPQLYGTQVREQSGRLVPFPIEDEEHVDDRRRKAGMPPLARYVRDTARVYGVARGEGKRVSGNVGAYVEPCVPLEGEGRVSPNGRWTIDRTGGSPDLDGAD